MVDVGAKPSSNREAVAEGRVLMQVETLRLIRQQGLPKGDVLTTAQIAGTLAAKRTHELIPLCHPLPISYIEVALTPTAEAPPPFGGAVEIRACVRCTAPTGVEMEALTAVSVAALTVYDMAKAVDRGMRISDIRLREKRGGASGEIRLP